MELTPSQKKRISEEYHGFSNWIKGEGKNEREEHLTHARKIKTLAEPQRLEKLTEDGLLELYDSLWASNIWGNKKWYIQNKVLEPNGLEKIRTSLKNLLYGEQRISERYDAFTKDVAGLGPAAITEILHFVFPDKYCLWNDKPKTILPYLGIDQLHPTFYKYQLKDGRAYEQCIEVVDLVRKELEKNGFPHPDFIDADQFFWYLFNKVKSDEGRQAEKGKKAQLQSISHQINDPSYVPPIVSSLSSLALNETSPDEFEKKVGVLFKMLGFKVEALGHGKGAVPDVIARGFGLDNQYAILIDCKARSTPNYQINTSDQRAIIEYIKSFLKVHEHRGTEVYFLIVSSGFNGESAERIHEIKSETRCRSICLISAMDLLYLLELKLQNYKVDVDRIRELFVGDGPITRERISELFPSE